MPDDWRAVSQQQFSAITRRIEDAPVVQVYGEVDLSTIPRLRQTISEAVAADGKSEYPPTLLLDLSQTEFFDSSGVGLLVDRQRELRKLGTEIEIVVGGGPVLRILRNTGLDKTFTLHPDLDTAAQNLRSP